MWSLRDRVRHSTFSPQSPLIFLNRRSGPDGFDDFIKQVTCNHPRRETNTLVYCMGDEADYILPGLKLTDEQKNVFLTVRDAFDSHFVVKNIDIYERARFNLRKQGDNETVKSFVKALYTLAEHCNYGSLHDEFIRDRLVDLGLSECLQLDKDLTLEKAISMTRQSEEVKNKPQQCALRDVYKSNTAQRKWKFSDQKLNKTKAGSSSCPKCGKSPFHAKQQCPAKDVNC